MSDLIFDVLSGDFICELDGFAYFLGPEALEELNWNDAV